MPWQVKACVWIVSGYAAVLFLWGWGYFVSQEGLRLESLLDGVLGGFWLAVYCFVLSWPVPLALCPAAVLCMGAARWLSR
ncbi:hypothetical protein [Segniliparus rugosus]|uniref:Uncharacterized protein n=1 Tax=Segniliparus rugosus (strain ATCC BAA-974 / DSM 45345 / CCUG 50838 / CIP 108380 / JCM 13579 / CDC 945) TaxID=679197 RepID=E5XPR0_SEGRC|nr:hypothetical protein [Segniliparus rugosus]EFV13658.2 hypothetical protein HMPREF9336_01482 [Segniliparus rugosus ATCC BAA-974]